MNIPRPPHSWRLSPRRAIALQKQMAELVCQAPLSGTPRFIAGVDAAFSPDEQWCIAGVVLWDLQERCVKERHTARRKLNFPYIPGLLSFREIPAWVAALRKLRQTPDVLLCDGHGLAHPRRFGIACHLGILCGLPSIGCGKSRLIGTHDAPALARGSRAALVHKEQVIGAVLRTQTGINPVYVSVGHQIDLSTAVAIVLRCATQYRLPEPTRLADHLVAEAKRALKARSQGPRSDGCH
ncbi:MAG TPA: deoxyribonuclease V [Bacillota bacterium]|nr:deoxyribonuclease V [Bacillota bacterium]